MIRPIWYRLRRIRPHTLFLLFIISLVIYCLQLPDSLAEHPEHSTGHHHGLLVTTPTNSSYPLHYISLDSIHGRLKSTPVAAHFGQGRQSISHLVGHPRRDNLFYVNNEVTPGSIIMGTIQGMRNSSNVNLSIHSQGPSQGDEPAYSLVTRDGQHLIAINVGSYPHRQVSADEQYGSPTAALYSIEAGGQLQLRQTISLPRPTWHDNTVAPHPHHIAQHPRDSRTFYIPDLGYNVVYVLRQTRNKAKTSLDVVQIFDTRKYGGGPRNGVVSHDGMCLELARLME
jgi:6-phosphogluconolactonase (cycloisomerase 2 family)